MKTKNLFLLLALITDLGFVPAGRVAAQTFTTLHSFSAGTGDLLLYTNSDGAGPLSGLILATNTLYGRAARGGNSGLGTLFKVNTDGTGFTIVYSFTDGVEADFEDPAAGLVLSGNTLYGTRRQSVFQVNT